MPLNDRQIRNAKPNEKKQTLSDGGGLALLINPAARGGTKFFVYNFRFDGRQQSLRLGKYPDTSLAEARAKHRQARIDLAKGINPAAAKQDAKAAKAAALANTFENIAREWHQKQLPRWKDNHAARVLRYFEIDVFPLIGQSPIDALRVKDIKEVLDRVDGRGATETAEKIRQWINNIFNHAARLELTDSNPAAPLVGYLQLEEVKHMPSLPCQRLTEFYQRLSLDGGVPTASKISTKHISSHSNTYMHFPLF